MKLYQYRSTSSTGSVHQHQKEKIADDDIEIIRMLSYNITVTYMYIAI